MTQIFCFRSDPFQICVITEILYAFADMQSVRMMIEFRNWASRRKRPQLGRFGDPSALR